MEAQRVRSNGPPRGGTLPDTLMAWVAPTLLARKQAYDSVRVWVPGCATGEAAYVVAGVLWDYAQRRDDPPAIQVFATDSDERAIADARRGRYSERLAAAIPPEWLSYFTHDGQQYQAAAARNLITFARHQLLSDPPFARLDLVVCWGTLAALAPDQREHILHTLHWSLRPGGYLLVNPADDGEHLPELFEAYAGDLGLFRRQGASTSLPRLVYRPAQEPQADDQLQMLNQHLQAMNQALRRKVGELGQANNDLDNLLRATDLATIFLDRALAIARFTPQAQALFNLIPADLGRPLAHITHALDYDELIDDAAQVLATLQGSEREVQGPQGRWYLVHLRPYRTDDARIDGVVLVCVDITARRLAEEELRRAHDELELRVLERTHELSAANERLHAEIAGRAQLEQERAELLRKLVMVQEDERRRIARELHDQLGQSVSALGLGLALLAGAAPDPASQQRNLARLQQITVQLDQDMRRLAVELRPTLLDDLGLIEAIQHLVERWAEHTGIQAEFQAVGPLAVRLPPELESVIYRVIQEALTNALKHAQAANVSVILEQRRDHVRLIVEDDGRGFDLDALQQAPSAQGRLGLLGMRERVALLGGVATIETAPGAGTTLFVELPIAPQELEQCAGA